MLLYIYWKVMMSYIYKLQIWTHCKSVPGTKKDVDRMFVDGDLTMRAALFWFFQRTL